jgi:hypothetical protein
MLYGFTNTAPDAFIIINRAQTAGIQPKVNLLQAQVQVQPQPPQQQDYQQKPMQTV